MEDFGEWVDVNEDLPQIDRAYKNISKEVECLLEDGSIVIGFFAFNYDEWFRINKVRRMGMEVIAWRDR